MQLTTGVGQTGRMPYELNLFSELDKGICDMEAGKELPLEEAFQKISELRDNRRHAGA